MRKRGMEIKIFPGSPKVTVWLKPRNAGPRKREIELIKIVQFFNLYQKTDSSRLADVAEMDIKPWLEHEYLSPKEKLQKLKE